MINEQKHLPLFNIFCLCMITAMLFSCGTNEKHIGTYLPADVTQNNSPKQIIILKEKGVGLWQTVDDEVSFTWNIKNGELRLHFKPSGVIAGKVVDNKIIIELPGSALGEFIKSSK